MTRAPAARAASILLVEDSETQALKLTYLLEQQGFRVTVAPSAEVGLERLSAHLPDLIIADLNLPGMDGSEFVRNLRLNALTRAIPVLMLTDSRERRQELQGLDSGADAYVSKSADWDLIVLRLRALMRRRAGEQRPVTAAALPSSFRRARVVVADGDAGRAEGLRALLLHEGYTVEVAATEQEAVALCRKVSPDAAVVNMASDSFDGIELCRRLSALRVVSPLAADPPAFQLVMVCATLGKHSLTDAFAAGADDVIASDVDDDGIRMRIRTLVRRKLLQDEDRRIEAELRVRDRALDLARAEAEAAQARAALSDALEKANAELAETNERLRDAQGKLVHAAKMASLGELVAGIAHEINNPLAFILAHQRTVEGLISGAAGLDAETVAVRMAKAHDRLRAMQIGLERIRELVLNLKKFSRFEEGDFQRVDVPAAIDTVVALLAPKLSDRIVVERAYAAPDALYCSPGLFNQVVMNIIGNAADAIPGKGRVTVSTRVRDASYIIEIADDGPGIPEDVRDRIFEPFFTTKPMGAGTGLGLAIAYGVVEAHGGAISVENDPSGGARFRLSIPVRRDGAERPER